MPIFNCGFCNEPATKCVCGADEPSLRGRLFYEGRALLGVSAVGYLQNPNAMSSEKDLDELLRIIKTKQEQTQEEFNCWNYNVEVFKTKVSSLFLTGALRE